MYMLCYYENESSTIKTYIFFFMIIQLRLIFGTASEMCIYTNDQFLVEAMDVEEEKSEDGKEQTVFLYRVKGMPTAS